mgnify:CR=1 FL=1
MTNADDSPPSDSSEGDGQGERSGNQADGTGGDAEQESPADSGGSGSLHLGSEADTDQSGSGFSLPKPSETEKAVSENPDLDDSPDDTAPDSGSLPEEVEPEEIEIGEEDLIEEQQIEADDILDAREIEEEDLVEENPIEDSDSWDASDIHEVDDDLIVEEEPESDEGFEVPPTEISSEHLVISEPAEEASPGESGEMSGLGAMASEMEEAEKAGELHDEGELDFEEDETIDDEFDVYEETVISDDVAPFGESPGAAGRPSADSSQSAEFEQVDGSQSAEFEQVDGSQSAEFEQVDSSQSAEFAQVDSSQSAEFAQVDSSQSAEFEQVESGPRSRSVSQNPPTPEQAGQSTTGSRPTRDPTAEAIQEDLDLDDEFTGQETELYESPFENDPIYPRLTVLEGPSTGQEYLLNKLRNSIGRSTKNSVVVPDETMSRQHMEVIQQPDDTYSIKDLQSVNGTYLNGTKIREADLFHGDRIEVGETVLQFVIPGESPRSEHRNRRLVPAPDAADDSAEQTTSSSQPVRPKTVGEQSPDKFGIWLNRIIFAAVILIVPLAATFVYLTLRGPSEVDEAKVAETRKARQAFLAGVEAVKEREWSHARTKFETARELDPELPGVNAQLKRLDVESTAEKSLEKARAALEENKSQHAIDLAEAIPRDSVYYEDAREIIRRQRRKSRLAALYDKANGQFGDGKNQKALSTIQRILNTVPNHEKALTLRRRILAETDADLEEAKETAKREEKKVAQKRKVARKNPRRAADNEPSDDDSSWLIDDSAEGSSGSSSTSSSSSSGSGRVVNFTKGFALYKQKNFDGAIAHFRSAASDSSGSVSRRAEKAAKNIGSFRKAYRAANGALKSGSWETAVDRLRDALRADKDVANASFFQGEINQKLARAIAKMGEQDFGSGNYSAAYKHYQQARQYGKSRPPVRDLRRKLEKKATSMYIKAAAKRKTDPGKTASLCRTIMSMVPPGSKNHKKARKLLDEI